MENTVMSGRSDPEYQMDRKFPIMRTLARLHECDVQTLFSRVDATELDVHDILSEMVSKNEVEASRRAKGGNEESFALTLKGWGEYLKALSSIYELPE